MEHLCRSCQYWYLLVVLICKSDCLRGHAFGALAGAPVSQCHLAMELLCSRRPHRQAFRLSGCASSLHAAWPWCELCQRRSAPIYAYKHILQFLQQVTILQTPSKHHTVMRRGSHVSSILICKIAPAAPNVHH